MSKLKIALIGNPNVGKSTIYNALTRNNVHTGNWSGKTVEYSKGTCSYEGTTYEFYDLPGTYSLISKSKEEMVATDFICFEEFDVALVVVDATSINKGLNLVLQTQELCRNVVVALNLIDEATKKNIKIDIAKLSQSLNCPVIATSAKNKTGLKELLLSLKNSAQSELLDLDYSILNESITKLSTTITNTNLPHKWVAMRLLENNEYYLSKFQELNIKYNSNILNQIKSNLQDTDISLEIVMHILKKVQIIVKQSVQYPRQMNIKQQHIDRVLTSKVFGIPLMLCLLFFILFLTIKASNYPSNLLFNFFSSLETPLTNILNSFKLPLNLISLLVNGIYKTLYWVISVMMPPMLIFFPLFAFFEDLGLLPRIAFNLDHVFCKCQTCGKQALTMCMGLGCNAVGVTSSRIIDSKRERIIAILTNVFIPCNGKFPTLISLITIFFVGLSNQYGALLCALILTLLIALGVLITFLISYILSKTILKGMPSSFTLELPPYRFPNIIKTIYYSVKTKALYVLIRAIKVAIPAGLVIWLIANVKLNNIPLLVYFSQFLNPFGKLLGLDGTCILSLLLGLPANEIVVPSLLMSYLQTSSLIDISNLNELKAILLTNGWTIKTAICFLIIMMFHYPCSTTLLTIKKETNSWYYTFLSFIIPLITGIIICLIINLIF